VNDVVVASALGLPQVKDLSLRLKPAMTAVMRQRSVDELQASPRD